jgi:hypothetical protein
VKTWVKEKSLGEDLSTARLKLKIETLAKFSMAKKAGVARVNNTRTFYLTEYLVDPASSHMLVSKIKPCMSKCK